ncbi:MAG: VHS domain-containing protein [Benniella sp.]|nr:MAG: VHS domain-containing protein [Benniella sp.]
MNYGQAQRQKSILEAYIERACDPSRYEPDLALNLEICDVIKEKQKNTPREAAIYIVRLINHKNMHVGMLALVLLDNCVKNCGHPFHLQIATKEFLNALVRKFPERPLAVPTPVQTRILEMIHEWYTTLCKTSRYKDDLVHIRDMHRLLTFKGYRFPQSKRIAESVLNPIDSLKSPAELEEEDRIAQAAQLQELIRRGRPEDVRAANDLVRRMTGFDQNKPNYSEQTSVELDKLHQKATLLIEMLNDVKPGEIIGRGDIFEDLFGTCKAAHSKVQKFITDKEDPDNMEQLIELDQLLNSVIEQYQQVKNGNFVKVSLPEGSGDNNNQTQKSQGKGVSTPKQTQPSLLDLLDFDGSSSGSSSSTTAKATGNLMDDLANLSFSDAPSPLSWGATGSISLDQSANNLFDLANPSSPTNGGAPNYNIFASPISSVNPVSVGSTSHISAMPVLQQKPAVQSTASPLDDFEFVSNTGAPAQDAGPISVTLMNKNGFQVDLDIEKQLNPDRTYMIKAYFSNHQNSPLTSLTFRVAVPRTLQLKLDPQSAQVVPPFSQKTVTQEMTIQVPANVAVVRMRYHLSYVTGGRTIEEQGEFSQFP